MRHVFITERQLRRLFTPQLLLQPGLKPEAQQAQHRHNDQGQEGSKAQAVNHRPGQRAPECSAVAAKEDMRVKLREKGGKINIQSYCQRYQAEDSSRSGK